jgi:Holliday junction resolvase
MSGNSSPLVYETIVQLMVDHLEQQGFTSLKANSQGFVTPGKVRWDEEDDGVIPDITGEHKGSVYVFEIETRDDLEAKKVEDRWRLLSVYAKRHQGKFYLVIPETKADYLKDFVEDLTVQPEFLKLKGID